MRSSGMLLVVAVALFASNARLATAETDKPDESECPSFIRGAVMTFRQIPNGVAVELTTPNRQNVADLQTLVGEAAAFIEYKSKMSALHSEPMVMKDGTQLPALDISVQKLPNGALANVRTEKPADAAVLLAEAKKLKQMWDTNNCTVGAKQTGAHLGH